MLYREIIAVCSQIHTKRINTLCGQNVELLNVKSSYCKVFISPQRVNNKSGVLMALAIRITSFCYLRLIDRT